ncbi:MAG: hypothetical protein K6E50_05210 [Lachnospiraceae bacterium]|nr:hypothetical protein [Lachnospiraceae bacterium]
MKDLRKRLSAPLFWAGLVFELLVSPSGYMIGNYHESLIILLGMLCFSLSLLCSMDLKRDWKVFIPLFAFALACYFVQHSALILRICLILLAGREMEREKVFRFFFIGTAVTMLAGLVLAFTPLGGDLYVEDAFRHVTERRYSFGFLHVNGFAFFWIRLILLGFYLYEEKLRAIPVFAAAALFSVPLILCRSKTALAVFALLCVWIILRRLVKDREKLLKFTAAAGGLMIAFELLLVFTLGIFPYPEATQGEIHNYWDLMNEVTTGRLEHGQQLLKSMQPSLLGMRGLEDATEIGFIHSLYFEGILFVAVYCIMLFWLLRRTYREKDMQGMVFLLVFALYSLAEAFLPYVNKNGTWLLLIAGLPAFMMPRKRSEAI